jgi:photosystem II stability/assembly factor-like uncharacterized protein
MIPALLLLFGLPPLAVGSTAPLPAFEWRLVGPFRGGRVLAVSGVAGDPVTFYMGGANGGVWKTTNAGVTWRPIFDREPFGSIGAIAVAPSDPRIIYVGTGEADLRADLSSGGGVFKSTDGGATWADVGLHDTQHVGKIVVHPKDPALVYVAALGHAYDPNEERGVFRSRDGGKTWQKVLGRGPTDGAIDLALDPDDPRVVYATIWAVHRPPWSQYPPVNDPGSGLFRSKDAGDTWTEVKGNGLPDPPWGRAGVAVAPGGRRLYTIIDAKGGGLFRSDDAGATWVRTTNDPRISNRGWYFGEIALHPRDPDTVYLPNVSVYLSKDAGKTFHIVKGSPGGDDYHALWIDRDNPSRMILGTDQGATLSQDGGETWSSWTNQPTAQLYHVTTDDLFPYSLYASQQDSGSVVVPSRTDHSAIGERDRGDVGGGESGYIAVDPKDPSIVYAGNTYGVLFRYDRATSQAQTITPWLDQGFQDISERPFRFTWTSPLVFSPMDPGRLYYGSQFLLQTTDGGLHWEKASPDLTGASPEKPAGPATVENARARGFGVIYSIAPSPLATGLVWTGSDSGLVHLTRDGGKTWTDVTPKGLSPWSKVTDIEASHFDPAVAYAAVDRHRLGDMAPHLFKTADFGASWTEIALGIGPRDFLNAVREDPRRRGLLFAATEGGVYVSLDDGGGWRSLNLNLPPTSVRDLRVHGDDLVIATHGRSFWILDDMAPLRDLAEATSREAFLFAPAPAVRLSSVEFRGTPEPLETPQAKNPPDGAILDFFLSGEPQGEVALEFLDEAGRRIRRVSTEDPPPPHRPPMRIADAWLTPLPTFVAHKGMNRFVWDLRYASPTQGVDVDLDSETGRPPRGPQVLPGPVTVRLSVGGQVLTRTLDVRLDPRSRATHEELVAQRDLALQASEALSDLYTRIRAVSRAAGGDVALKKLHGIESKLRAVLQAALSADRRPPSQAYALLEQARQDRAGLEAAAP